MLLLTVKQLGDGYVLRSASLLKLTFLHAFYINLVIGAILAPAYLFLLPNTDFKRGTPITKKLQQMDWLGIVVFDGAMACLVMAINFGGSLYAWDSANEIVLWVMAGVLFIAFGITQWLTPFVGVENKLYPTHFFRKPVLLNLQFQLFLASGILFVSSKQCCKSIDN